MECVPTIEVHKQIVGVPAELTRFHDNPGVPNAGDNAMLLDWAMACAVNNNAYRKQVQAISGLSERQVQ